MIYQLDVKLSCPFLPKEITKSLIHFSITLNSLIGPDPHYDVGREVLQATARIHKVAVFRSVPAKTILEANAPSYDQGSGIILAGLHVGIVNVYSSTL